MALSNEIKDGMAFLKDLQSKAKDKKPELEKAAKQLESLAAALKGLAGGDQHALDVTLTRFEGANRLLLAKASAEHELVRSAPPDWDKIGDGVVTVLRVALKIAAVIA